MCLLVVCITTGPPVRDSAGAFQLSIHSPAARAIHSVLASNCRYQCCVTWVENRFCEVHFILPPRQCRAAAAKQATLAIKKKTSRFRHDLCSSSRPRAQSANEHLTFPYFPQLVPLCCSVRSTKGRALRFSLSRRKRAGITPIKFDLPPAKKATPQHPKSPRGARRGFAQVYMPPGRRTGASNGSVQGQSMVESNRGRGQRRRGWRGGRARGRF